MNNELAVKRQTKLKNEDFQEFNYILQEIAQSKSHSNNGQGSIGPQSKERLFQILKKCEKDYADYCAISGGIFQYTTQSKAIAIKNFIEVFRNYDTHTQ